MMTDLAINTVDRMSVRRRNVACVVVTYANRRDHLTKVLDSLPRHMVARAIVVDNGAHWPVRTELTESYGDFVDVIEMGHNTGSAGGYAAGIARAITAGADFLWLLDDDNRPQPDCLDVLLTAYSDLSTDRDRSRLAVVAFRPEHQPDVAAGTPVGRLHSSRNSFRGFNVFDIPYKLWKRTSWGRSRAYSPPPPLIDLPFAPYSGLLFHRSIVESFGLPREDFVLYADDHDYTVRITDAGGRIVLVAAAMIEDLESSWSVRQEHRNAFDVILQQGSDLRVYFGMRNGVYFDRHRRVRNRILFWLNRKVFLAALFLRACMLGRLDRYDLVSEAVADGLAGRLGPHSRFPL